MPLNGNFALTKLLVSDCARMAGGAAPAVFDDLILHIAPDKFYLESLSSTQSVLVIDRISYEISLQVAQNIKRIFLREGQEKQSIRTFPILKLHHAVLDFIWVMGCQHGWCSSPSVS